MNMVDLAGDYLIDPKEGMRKLIAGYLNEVMQLEAQKQIRAGPYERTAREKAIVTDQDRDHLRPFTGT
jgi:putative transposase